MMTFNIIDYGHGLVLVDVWEQDTNDWYTVLKTRYIFWNRTAIINDIKKKIRARFGIKRAIWNLYI